ncbi:MAG: hypothetical protein SGI89_11295 [bacterium]|nr:hypothetical protein [bacterium]
MKLPNQDKAIIEIEKVRDYCLNKDHPVGKHKAFIFESKLGITSNDYIEFREILFDAIKNNEAKESFSDKYGKRFSVDFSLRRSDFSASVRSLWIVRSNEDFPRFTSCYIKN